MRFLNEVNFIAFVNVAILGYTINVRIDIRE